MLYTVNTSRRNVVGLILDESMSTKVVDLIRKYEWIIVVKFVLEIGLAIIISVYAPQLGFAAHG